jgi:hypothetical protein
MCRNNKTEETAMSFWSWLFGTSKRMSKEEIGAYLAKVSKYDLSNVVGCVALTQHLSEKGLKMAAKGQKILKKHRAVFQGCRTGSDIGSRVIAILEKWPSLSAAELAVVSDIVVAHKSLNP